MGAIGQFSGYWSGMGTLVQRASMVVAAVGLWVVLIAAVFQLGLLGFAFLLVGAGIGFYKAPVDAAISLGVVAIGLLFVLNIL